MPNSSTDRIDEIAVATAEPGFYRKTPARPMVWLLVVPAGIVLIQFVALAAGKPGEYARFALWLPEASMIIESEKCH